MTALLRALLIASIFWTPFALGSPPEATIVQLEEVTLSSGAHFSRLYMQSQGVWPALAVESKETLRWGSPPQTFMEAFASLSGAMGLTPGASSWLSFVDGASVMVPQGAFMAVARVEGFNLERLAFSLLLEPKLRAVEFKLSKLTIGGQPVEVAPSFDTFQGAAGAAGITWYLDEPREALAARAGDIEMTVDMRLITDRSELVIDLKEGAEVTVGPVTVTVGQVRVVEDDAGRHAEVQIGYKGGAFLALLPEHPGVEIQNQFSLHFGNGGTLRMNLAEAPPEGASVHVVIAQVTRHREVFTLPAPDFARWFTSPAP